MKAIVKLELRKSVQDKGLVFWTFILPVIFTILFISIFTATVEEQMKQEVIVSIVPGYTVMFVFFIIISMGTSFINDRDTGLIARLASTPLPPMQYLLGKWLPFALIVLIQIVVLQTFGKVVYTIPIEQPIFLFILAIALTFCTTGIGLAISVIIRTNNMGIAITQIIALVGALIGGLWIPFDMMPDFFQQIGTITPQYWAHDGFKHAMTGTLTSVSLLRSVSVLLGYGILGLIVSLISYPAFLHRAKN